MLQVGTMLVALYHRNRTRAKSTMRRRLKATIGPLESSWMLMETRVMIRDRITIMGGIIWVRGGLLVNPFWLIFYCRDGVIFMLSSFVVSYLFMETQ